MNDVGNEESGNVHELNLQGTPVLWSCCRPEAFTDGSQCGKEEKLRLLCPMLMGENLSSHNLVCDGLGRPLLLLNDAIGPSISFSHCNGITWAALANSKTDVGIDAERAEELGADYPFRRVFHIDEPGDGFTPLLKHNGGNRSRVRPIQYQSATPPLPRCRELHPLW